VHIGTLGMDDRSIDAAIAGARAAADAGYSTYWLPGGGRDALTLIAVAAREVPGIEMGSAVLVSWPMHPVIMAEHALTAADAAGGRLVLGLGLGHPEPVAARWGMGYERPVKHLREYLSILVPLLDDRQVDFDGELLSSHTVIALPDAPRPQLLIAALGPQVLKVAGELADGTITWMVASSVIGDLTAPTLSAAAQAAGRPAPRIVTSMPVCVTADAAGARERAATQFAMYDRFPAYKAQLDRVGASGPADVAMVGDEDDVLGQIAAFAAAGATDFYGFAFGDAEELTRTRAVLSALAQRSSSTSAA
jgi:F420-dependent oxidoreductase-like protein